MNDRHKEREQIGMEAMQIIRDAIPWGETFRVGGAVCTLAELGNGPKLRALPGGYVEAIMMFDVRVEGGKSDHVEITMKVTGGGGAI